MKKCFILFLLICSLIGGCQAYAEENGPGPGVEVEYEGVWFPLTELGLQVYMPYEEWGIFEDEKVYLMAGDAAGAQLMWIEVFDNTDGYTNDSIYNEFSTSAYENVYEIDFTNVRLTCFEYALNDENERICAVTLSADSAYICYIYFSPNSLLAQQIISTISLLGANTGEVVNW